MHVLLLQLNRGVEILIFFFLSLENKLAALELGDKLYGFWEIGISFFHDVG
jgi:hypothetical protein